MTHDATTTRNAKLLPPDWRQRCDRCELAVGLEGGTVHEVDLDGAFYLVHDQGTLLALFEEVCDEDLSELPSQYAQRFDSAPERESSLRREFGRLLLNWRGRQVLREDSEPYVGRLYPADFGWGYCTVVEIETDAAGAWTRVKVDRTTIAEHEDLLASTDPDGHDDGQIWMARDEWIGSLERAIYRS